MKDRFDDMISKEFSDKFSNIHASEDLISRTLAAIEKECDPAPAKQTDNPTTLTAIDQNYISGYVRKMSKKTHIRIAALTCAAAACAMVFAGVLLMKRGDFQRLNALRSRFANEAAQEQITVPRKAVPENNSIVAMGYTIPTGNYFTARSLSNRREIEPLRTQEQPEENEEETEEVSDNR